MKIPAAFTALLLAPAIAPIYAGTVVLPNADAGIVANDSSGSLAGSIPSFEFQDIWSKTQFSSTSGSLLITQLAWRLKPGTGSINATATSASLFMSTTTFSPATMTTTFAANRGADFTMVDSLTGTLWSSGGCTGPGPCPFDIVYTLSTPFLYNPANGNLLIEGHVTGYNGVGTGQFDVQNYAINPVVGELTAIPISATGAQEFSANVTQLVFTPAPEPAYAWELVGLAALVMLRQYRTKPGRSSAPRRSIAD